MITKMVMILLFSHLDCTDELSKLVGDCRKKKGKEKNKKKRNEKTWGKLMTCQESLDRINVGLRSVIIPLSDPARTVYTRITL